MTKKFRVQFMKKNSLRIVILVTLFIINFCPPGYCFGTLGPFNVHKAILEEALKPLGVSSSNLTMIDEGSQSQDSILSSKFFNSPDHHCDDNKISESRAYIQQRFDLAAIYAENAYKSPEALKKTLYTLGEGFHTLQDFYSHSNYLEMLLSQGANLRAVNWDSIPAGCKTGYAYFKSVTENEYTTSRGKIISILQSEYGGNLKFNSDEKYKSLITAPTYQKALDYVLAHGTDCMHFEMHKDNDLIAADSPITIIRGDIPVAGSLIGSIIVPKYGKTFHALAKQLAVEDTQIHWELFEKKIRKEYGPRAKFILCALKGLDMPWIKFELEKIQSPLNPGDTIKGIARVFCSPNTEKNTWKLRAYIKGSNDAPKEYILPKDILEEAGKALAGPKIPLEQNLPVKIPVSAISKCKLVVEAALSDDPGYIGYFAETLITVGGEQRKFDILLVNASGKMFAEKKEKFEILAQPLGILKNEVVTVNFKTWYVDEKGKRTEVHAASAAADEKNNAVEYDYPVQFDAPGKYKLYYRLEAPSYKTYENFMEIIVVKPAIKIKSVEIPKIIAGKMAELAVTVLVEGIDKNIPVTYKGWFEGKGADEISSKSQTADTSFGSAEFIHGITPKKPLDCIWYFRVEAPGFEPIKNSRSIKTAREKIMKIVSAEVAPPKGKVRQKFSLKIVVRFEGYSQDEEISLKSRHTVKGPLKLPFPEKTTKINCSTLPKNGADLTLVSAQVQLGKKGKYAWNYAIEAPCFIPSKLTASVPFEVDEAQSQAGGVWALKPGYPQIVNTPGSAPQPISGGCYRNGDQHNFTVTSFTGRQWNPGYYNRELKKIVWVRECTFNFKWGALPAVIKQDEFFDINISGAAAAASDDLLANESVLIYWIGLKAKILGEIKNGAPLKYYYQPFKDGVYEGTGVMVGPEYSGPPILNNSKTVRFNVMPDAKIIKIFIWSLNSGSVTYEYEKAQ